MKNDNISYLCSMAFFGTYVLKCMVLGASFADAAIIACLGITCLIYSMKLKSRDLEYLTQKIDDLQEKQDEQMKIISEVRTKVTGAQLQQTIRKL